MTIDGDNRAIKLHSLPLNVALVSPSLHVGGAERQMVLLAAALPRDIFDPRFILLSDRGTLADEAEAAGIRVDVLGLGRSDCPRPYLRCAKALGRALRRYRALTRSVAIVDAWSVPAYTWAGLVNPVARVPVVVAGRRSLPDVARTRTRLREAARSVATRRVDGVVANSRAVADAWIAHDNLDPRLVHVVPNAVAPRPSSASDRAAVRRSWGVSDDVLLVGCVANLRPGKGHALLLQVAVSLREQRPNLRWRLIGNGPLRPDLQAEIRRLDLADIVAIDTDVADARTVLSAFDLAVQASDSEGMPNAVLEAVAAGLPVVATDVGGTSEVVDSVDVGLLVPRGDIDALAGAIALVAQDETLRRRLGEAALCRSRAFSIERLRDATAAYYLELFNEKFPGLSTKQADIPDDRRGDTRGARDG